MKLKIPGIKKFLTKNWQIIFILAIAAFLRLYKISDYMTFLGDEGRDVLVAYNILHGHLTLLGPTSSVGGFFLGPIYYYFMAPFLWLFNYNPVGPAIGVALIGILTVWLVYKVSLEFFSKKVGLIAASLYAVSPIVIIYSHSSWNPNPLPFFSLLTLFILYKSYQTKPLIYVLLSGILLGISMQLHYLSIFLGIVMGVFMMIMELIQKEIFLTKVIELIKKYFVLFVGFLIGWSLFLAFELRHGFPDFQNIFKFVLYSGNTGAGENFISTISDVFFRLFGRLVFAYPQIDHLNNFNQITKTSWVLFSVLTGILATLLLIKYFFESYKSKDKTIGKYIILICWLFFGVILFGFYKKEIYEYYFAFMFPLPFMLVALLISRISEIKKSKISLIFGSVFLILITLLNLSQNPFWYPANRQLNQMRTIADFVMTKTNAKPFNFALVSGGNSDFAYRYFFTIWNHPPVTIQYRGVDPKRTSVSDQLLVVCESPLPCHPLGNSLWEIAGFGRAEIEGHWNVSVVEIYKLVHYKGK